MSIQMFCAKDSVSKRADSILVFRVTPNLFFFTIDFFIIYNQLAPNWVLLPRPQGTETYSS